MSSVRTRTLVTGSVLAVIAALLTDHGAFFGADLPKAALFGIAAGAVLGLVPDRSPALRLGGFAGGFLAAWVGYALRAGVLPDIPMGRAIAAAIVIAVVTAVATASSNRLPMWAGFLGVATLAGAYETTFNATPTGFVADSLTAVTASALAVAVGFLVSELLGGTARVTEGLYPEHDVAESAATPVPVPRVAADSNVLLSKKVEA